MNLVVGAGCIPRTRGRGGTSGGISSSNDASDAGCLRTLVQQVPVHLGPVRRLRLRLCFLRELPRCGWPRDVNLWATRLVGTSKKEGATELLRLLLQSLTYFGLWVLICFQLDLIKFYLLDHLKTFANTFIVGGFVVGTWKQLDRARLGFLPLVPMQRCSVAA